MKVVGLPTYHIESTCTLSTMQIIVQPSPPKKEKGRGDFLLQKREKENKPGNKQTSKIAKSSSTLVEN